MAKATREDARWWLDAAIDDYESAQLLFKGGKHSKYIHVLHSSTEKALKAAILAERKRPPRGHGWAQPGPTLLNARSTTQAAA